MVELLHYQSLIDNRFYFLLSHQLVLSHDLHGIQTTRILFSHKNDSTEGTTSNNFYLLEVMPSHFQVSFCVLGEVQFGKVSTQEFTIFEDAYGSVILC